MKKVLLCVLVLFCVSIFHANAQIKWDAEKFMPLNQVKTGMKGKGYTVFFGTTVEEFEFEVVSIEYNFSPGWDVVWCKGTSDNFMRTGVAGGMSGSPIYIDGRLMGALSLGSFNQRLHANLFGVTPIQQMVKVAERGMKPNLTYAGAKFFDYGSEFVAEGLNIKPLQYPNGYNVTQEKQNNSQPQSHVSAQKLYQNSMRLSIPIALSRLDGYSMQLLKPFLDKYNMVPVQAAGGGGPVKKSPVEMGQIIGTQFVRGDYVAFGYGTITHIDKNELLAYGHSSSGEGNINMPLSGGYVHFILPSTSRSSKIASPTQLIGTLVQDRDPAIAGLIKKLPSTHHYLPVKATLQTSNKEIHDINYEVVREQFYTPLYTGLSISNIIAGREFFFNDHTVNTKATITLAKNPKLDSHEIVIENIFSSSGSPGSNVSGTVISPIRQLITNPFEKVRIESVNFDIKVDDKRKTAGILKAHLDKNVYRPGEEIELTLIIRPYLEQPETLIGKIKIPKDTPDGVVMLAALSGGSYPSWSRSRSPGSFRAQNINQLIDLLQYQEPNTNLILELSAPRPGLTVQGEEFPNLPISIQSVMNTALRRGETGYTAGTVIHTAKVATDYVMVGSTTIPVAVNRNAQ